MSNRSQTTAPFGTWRSAITPEVVTRAQVGPAEPLVDGTSTYWLERRPDEGGRVTLIKDDGNGPAELTPAPFTVRTRVHEYGGGAYAASGDVVVAVDFASQQLHRLRGQEPPTPITPASDGALRYADIAIDLRRNRLFAVREDHRSGGEPRNELVQLPLEPRPGGHDGTVVASGHDFVAAPALSPAGDRLAWITWDHPDMPWDATTLWLASIGPDGAVGAVERVAGGERDSVLQPTFAPDGTLVFLSDRTGFWNLYALEGQGPRPVCPRDADFGGPLWSLGSRWFGFPDDESILALTTENGRWSLMRIERATGRSTPLDLPYTALGGLAAGRGRAVVLAGAPDRPAAVVEIAADGSHRIRREAGALPVDPAWLSIPEDMVFDTPAGPGHALFYPPANPAFAAPAGERPPMIVKCHGGPTGMAGSELKLSTQFWTSRGFAVLDVNYGGSSGFGRAYRERLAGRWGEVDVDDAIAAARAVAGAGRADPDRLIISGGSAGGFTVLAALTFHDVFRAGASHYGIGDLEALAHETHKFESRYLDRLVGPYPECRDLYRARSPIHHADRLACPVIFFQGLEDRVVPPAQAEAMVAALRARGLPVAYLAFAGEQHGFRQAETIQTVLRAELTFYGRVFGFEPADALSDLVIENLP